MPKCISVRLQRLVPITDKCYKAVAFDGTEALIPTSQVYGRDYDVTKSEAYWITEWILQKKELTHGSKWTIFSKEGKHIGRITYKHHKPKKLDPNTINHDKKLER